MERVARIELAQPGRKHGILPLNYTRNLFTLPFNYTQLQLLFQVFQKIDLYM